MQNNTEFEAIVVGGGMVGATMALGLAQNGFETAVIEQASPPFYDVNQSYPDLRISALMAGSLNLLRDLGVVGSVMNYPYASFNQLETWEDLSSKVIFTSKELQLTQLGWMVENKMIQQAIWDKFVDWQNLSPYCNQTIERIWRQDNRWNIKFSSGRELKTSLIIGADGAQSIVRQAAGIGVSGWQYRQSCMLLIVQLPQCQAGETTWQAFQTSGPKAYLPLWDNWACLVWYDDPTKINQLMQVELSRLSQEIAKTFPDCLPAVRVVDRGSFNLTRQHARRYFNSGSVLVGDAAHTINPLAGQGANLGYRDVACLLKVLRKAKQLQQNIASDGVLLNYQRQRYLDNLMMQNSMELFYQVFSQKSATVTGLRNLGLRVAQHSGILKKWALSYALGI